ncbi:hypothetical protein G4G93_29475 [Methylobacterium sp. DB0501]|uniref:RyR domain-containing protein n=1 Tax=Methylobacterium sp. DB0501 TaxID=2709665 RepID=UPI0013E9DB34|nr:RyR domain-containing protein [Methylobacterium sp. DB0501]NGM37988.1 hypothetical protein [Methylobacterium sp. DB0501]
MSGAAPDGVRAATALAPRRVVVTGDLVVDHHLYEGEGDRPGLAGSRGVRFVDAWGGAAGLARLIAAAAPHRGGPGISVQLKLSAGPGPRQITHAYATWAPHPTDDREPEREPRKVWRARLLGFGEGMDRASAPFPAEAPDQAAEVDAAEVDAAADAPPADVFVLDDANLGARYDSGLFRGLDGRPTVLPGPPSWIILKTTMPVARGDLWSRLEEEGLDRTVCLVSADDLRAEGAAISRGLSWERTVADLRRALRTDPQLRKLACARHLVVALSLDGVLWVDRPVGASARAVLMFDPGGIEGRWNASRAGTVPGRLTAFAAALALWCAEDAGWEEAGWKGDSQDGDPEKIRRAGFEAALAAGLAAMRDLADLGHGSAGEKPEGFPVERVAKVAASLPVKAFARVEVPWAGADDNWTIVEAAQVPHGVEPRAPVPGLARLLVTHGPSKILGAIPYAVFGKMVAIDPQEIEALRGLHALMSAYRADTKRTRPLCLGVFGPPGAGKSFGVKQLAFELFGERSWLEFNLSQFEKPSDLMGPFHRGRDRALEGVVPVVLWDEFDSEHWKWLQYLIAPMQDGHFQDGQLTHSTGRAVWIFAGGTSWTFEHFKRNGKVPETAKTFKACKGPDFVSRLDGYFDVLGPNPRAEDEAGTARPRDGTFPLRRAQLVRSLLAGPGEGRLDIDSDLLNALLLVPGYRHGARSLDKLVASLRSPAGVPVRRSALPPPRQLDMFVDGPAFTRIIDASASFRTDQAVEEQAGAIHDAYRRQAGSSIDPHIDKCFKSLGAAEREDNVAAARRIIDVLSLIGMSIAQSDIVGVVQQQDYEMMVEHNIERLAEAEHDGWMAHRLANGWTKGPMRDFARRTHPCLVVYDELREDDRKKDRMMVRNYWRRICEANFRVVWLAAVVYQHSNAK